MRAMLLKSEKSAANGTYVLLWRYTADDVKAFAAARFYPPPALVTATCSAT